MIRSGTMYYPYWLAHAAAVCEQRGHVISLLDCPADDLGRADLADRVVAFAPDLVVSECSTASFSYDLETLGGVRDVRSGVVTCLVGTHVTAEWQRAVLHPAVDFAAIGEYDFTVADLADALAAGSADAREIPGLAAARDGVAERGPARLPIEDMDALPWIAPLYKRFLTPENYLFTIATHPMVMLIGGRGCTARCFYCVYPQVMHGHRYRTRSPEHLVGEMLWVQENMPEVREIVFEDDTFTSDRARAREIARLVRERGVRLPWFANIRANVDGETLAALKEAGLRECAVGFESGDDLVLANMRKGQVVAQQRAFMESARSLGILVHGCFMVGFPGETPETLQATLELALELDPDSAQFYPVIPYPGTGAYQWARDGGYLVTEDYEAWLTEGGGHRCVLNLPGLPPEALDAFRERAFMRFHFRPRYLVHKLRQLIQDPAEGRRSVRAGLNFVRYLLTTRRPRRAAARPASPPVPEPPGWRSRVKVPRGRMERQEDVLRRGRKRNLPLAELDGAVRAAEEEAQRPWRASSVEPGDARPLV